MYSCWMRCRSPFWVCTGALPPSVLVQPVSVTWTPSRSPSMACAVPASRPPSTRLLVSCWMICTAMCACLARLRGRSMLPSMSACYLVPLSCIWVKLNSEAILEYKQQQLTIIFVYVAVAAVVWQQYSSSWVYKLLSMTLAAPEHTTALAALLFVFQLATSCHSSHLCCRVQTFSTSVLSSVSTAVQGASAVGSCSEPFAGREEAGQRPHPPPL